jgi:hypothetical protein
MARWTLPSLNYRRGLLRVYLVLCVLWIITIAGTSVIDRPTPPVIFGKNDPVVPKDEFAPKPKTLTDADFSSADAPIPSFDDFKKEQQNEQQKSEVHSTARYWGTQSALAFTPPIAGYLILFGVIPWIGRGFRSTHL